MNVAIILNLVDRLTAPSRQAGRAFDEMGRRMQAAGQQIVAGSTRSTTAIRGIGTAANHSAAGVGRLAASMRNLRTYGHGLAGGGLTSMFGGGLLAGRIASTLFRFDDRMNEVQALMSASDDAMLGLREEVIRIGEKSRFAVSQVASGLVELARAGVYDPKLARVLLDGVTGLASATNAPMDRAADIATNIAKSFGMEITTEAMTEMTDSIAHAVRRTNFDMSELAESMKYTAFNAHKYGLSMKDTTAVLMSLAQRGIKGSTAGTGLARVIEGALGMSDKAAKSLAGIGIDRKTFFAEDGSIRLFEMVDQFRAAEEEFGKVKVGEAIYNVFGKRGGRIMLGLTEAPIDELVRYREIMADAEGAVREMELTRMKGLPGAWYRLVAAVEKLVLKFGDTGGLTATLDKIATKLRAWANAISNLSPGWLKFISHTVAGVAALGALAVPVMIFGTALRFLARMLFLPALTRGVLGGVFLGGGAILRQASHVRRLAGSLGLLRFALMGIARLTGIGLVLAALSKAWPAIKAIGSGLVSGVNKHWEGSELQRAVAWLTDIVPGLGSAFDKIKDAAGWLFGGEAFENNTLVSFFKKAEDAAWALLNPIEAIRNALPDLGWLNPFGGNGGGFHGALAGAAANVSGANPMPAPAAGVGRFATLPSNFSMPPSMAGPVTNNNDNSKVVNVGGINVTVNATTNASPSAIGDAVGSIVGSKVRGAIGSD